MEKGLTDALEGGQVENWAAVYSKSVTIYNADGEVPASAWWVPRPTAS